MPCTFFVTPDVRPLSTGAKLLYAYLHVNPATNLLGLYYLPRVLLSTETGLSKAATDRAWAELEGARLVRYDEREQLVYLPGFMIREAGGELRPGDRRVSGAAREIRALPRSLLLAEFLAEHPAINAALYGARDAASDGASMQGTGSGTGSRSGTGTDLVGGETAEDSSADGTRGRVTPLRPKQGDAA